VREDDCANADATPSSVGNSPAPIASADDNANAFDEVQDDSSDGGDEADSP
jgi:hypothetical protein